MKDWIVLESAGFDVEYHIDSVAKYLREKSFPEMDAQRIDFYHADGQSKGWFLSDQRDVTIVRIFEAYCHRSAMYTNGLGIMYISHAWNEAMFKVDGHYYFISK